MFLVLLKKYQKHFENIFLILFIIWCVDLILFSIEIINFNNLGILLLVLFSLLLLLFFSLFDLLKRDLYYVCKRKKSTQELKENAQRACQ